LAQKRVNALLQDVAKIRTRHAAIPFPATPRA